jgi:biotin operon repressor
MEKKDRILAYLRKKGTAGGRELREHLGITRQALNKHITALIDSGELYKTGSTRAARYTIAEKKPAARSLTKTFPLPGLAEDEVYEMLAVTFNLRTELSDNVEAILQYDFRFQKTRIHVKLLQKDYISRSEARRLLANLEKFSEIKLDFRGVRSIGQGFADEIFRVFINRHPGIIIESENANRVVGAMLRHVQEQ